MEQGSSLILFTFYFSKYIVIKLQSAPFSRSVMSDSLQPHGLQHAMLPCPSPTPGACSNSCPLSWWCHPAISSSVIPFSIIVSHFKWTILQQEVHTLLCNCHHHPSPEFFVFPPELSSHETLTPYSLRPPAAPIWFSTSMNDYSRYFM